MTVDSRTRWPRSHGWVVLLCMQAILVGCSAADSPVDEAAAVVQPPVGDGSSLPNLRAAADRLYLSWVVQEDERPARLMWSAWDGRGWSDPGTVAEEPKMFVNWADFPSMTPFGSGRLAAHMLVRQAEGYAYGAELLVSEDDGRSWSRAGWLHDDISESEHGFVSLLPGSDESVEAVWLDGRELAEGGQRFRLVSRSFGPDGFGPEALLDPDVCSCCQTDSTRAGTATVVAYRGRGEGERRDIRVVRRTAEGWSEPSWIHDDGWIVAACPVNGPALDAAGERVALAWFTAAQERPRVQVAFSGDGGLSFGTPIRIDEGNPAGRVDTVLLDDGSAVVSWLERAVVGEDSASAEARVLLARVVPGEGVVVSRVLGSTVASRPSGFPRIALFDGAVWASWTTPGPPSRVHVNRAVF